MRDLKGARIVVVGAGVIGLAAGLACIRRGADVVLHDPEVIGDNASGVAAGMLAPAFETLLDARSGGHLKLLTSARDQWPAFIESLSGDAVALDKAGALWAVRDVDSAGAQGIVDDLRGQGAQAEALDAVTVAKLQPRLGSGWGGVYTPDDWVLDPKTVLAAMALTLLQEGGRIERSPVQPVADGLFRSGADMAADAVVLATGWEGRRWMSLAPELAVMEPIKGQILHFDSPPVQGPVVRGQFGYVAPQARGAVVGATMQTGLTDRLTDPEALDGLRRAATQLFPHLAGAAALGRAGVRASTPDGLPLVGPSSRPGLFLALGARRNGWLLAPMVGELIAAHLLGDASGPFAEALAPQRRFSDGQR